MLPIGLSVAGFSSAASISFEILRRNESYTTPRAPRVATIDCMVRVVLDDGMQQRFVDVPSVEDVLNVEETLWVLSSPYFSSRALGSGVASRIPEAIPDIPRYVRG